MLDTSVLIASESGRPLDIGWLPEQTAVSVVTIGELHVGVLAAADTAVEPLPITAEAARRWAEIRVRLAEQGRRAKVNDLWIAAVALANQMDLVTQDDDFDVIEAAGNGCKRRRAGDVDHCTRTTGHDVRKQRPNSLVSALSCS